MKAFLAPGEFAVIDLYIHPGDRVFDVGAHSGTWLEAVLQAKRDVELHAFEPTSVNFRALMQRLGRRWQGQTVLNNIALSDRDGVRDFFLPGQGGMVHFPPPPQSGKTLRALPAFSRFRPNKNG